MALDPNEVQTADATPGEAEFVRPQDPLTEWTGRRILEELSKGTSFKIPTFDYEGFTYVGSTSRINTRLFKIGGASGTLVATLTYAYDGSDRISSVTLS